MPKNNKTLMQNFRINPIPYVVQIVAVVVAIFNIWIASKLSPIAQDIAVITTRVEAIEELDKTFIGRTEIEVQLKEINRRLSSIDDKIDNNSINER